MAHDVTEDGNEAEDAKRYGQEGEDFGELLQSAGKKNGSEEYCIDAGGLSVLHRHANWVLGLLYFLLLLRRSIFLLRS